MNTTQQHTPAVLYTADGQPYYLPGPAPVAPLIAHQPTQLPHLAHQQAPTAGQNHTPVAMFNELPGRDPWPARLLAGGIGTGAAGLGVGYMLQAVAQAATGLGLLAAVLALSWLLKNSVGSNGAGGRGAVNVHVTTHNRNR
ncbi:hypothetical protein AB0K43_03570 [Kitasatospora sp. NPDC049258]|uniref:hypothetical protein n=1 Tax=Kitasatospora sp. NPDC049258 TaxID=3155394 RepID=UPI00342D5C61